MLDLNKALKVAVKAVTTAGNYLKEFQRDVLIVKKKDKVDIQTNADLNAEKMIIDIIQSSYQDHNISSEEMGSINNHSPYTWVIDPLDGTSLYQKSGPIYASTIALESKEKILVSCMYFPSMQSIYTAIAGKKAYFNKLPLKVNTTKKLDESFIFTRLPYKEVPKESSDQIFSTVKTLCQKTYKVNDIYHGALALTFIAHGFGSAYYNLLPNRKSHDYSPGLLLVKSAGGKVTDRFGKPLKPGNLEDGIVASNGLIHQKLLSIINHNLQGPPL